MLNFPHAIYEPIAASCVALRVEIPEATDGVKEAIFSGFAVDMFGSWMWVTAAHVLDEIDDIARRFVGTKFSLQAAADVRQESVPFDYMGAEKVHGPKFARHYSSTEKLDDVGTEFFEQLGLVDVGLVWLEDLYASNLKVGRVVPFTRDQVVYDHLEPVGPAEERVIFVAGFPSSAWDYDARGEVSRATLRVLPIYPSNLDSSVMEFDPVWLSKVHTGSVKGMSGGPVVMTGFGKPLLLGVQSSEIIASQRGPSLVKVGETVNFFSLFELPSD